MEQEDSGRGCVDDGGGGMFRLHGCFFGVYLGMCGGGYDDDDDDDDDDDGDGDGDDAAAGDG